MDGQKGTALASSLWMGAENGSRVELAAPLAPGCGCPPVPTPVWGPAGGSVPWLCPTTGQSPLQQQGEDGELGGTYPSPELTATPESPEVPEGTPHPTRPEPVVSPLSPRARGSWWGALLGGCWWDTRLGRTVNSCVPPPAPPRGPQQRRREAEGTPSPPCPGAHPSGSWEEAEILGEIYSLQEVYSTGF